MAIDTVDINAIIAKAQRALEQLMLNIVRQEYNGQDANNQYAIAQYLSGGIDVLSCTNNGLANEDIEAIMHCMIKVGNLNDFGSSPLIFPLSTIITSPCCPTKITDLTDGPMGSLIGQELKVVRVKADGSGWEWFILPPIIISISYASLIALQTAGTLQLGVTYFDTDHEVYLQALKAHELSNSGICRGKNVDWQNATGNFAGQWTGTTNIKYDTLVGSFTIGELITGGTSGAIGELVFKIQVDLAGYRNAVLISKNGIPFQISETITGGTSGSTATLRYQTSTIAYNALFGVYIVGENITGGTSGATAVILAKGTGWLNIQNINTTAFIVADTITGSISTSTGAITNINTSPILISMTANKIVSWNNIHYKCIGGAFSTANPKYDTTNWSALALTDASYQIENDKCTFDLINQKIVRREDKRGNVVVDNSTGTNSIDKFQWGRTVTFGNIVYSFGFEGWNSVVGFADIFVQDSSCYIGDSAAMSFNVIQNRATVAGLNYADVLNNFTDHANLTALAGTIRNARLYGFADVTISDPGSNGGLSEYIGITTILTNASVISGCSLDGGSVNIGKIFSGDSQIDKKFKRDVVSTLVQSLVVASGTAALTLDASGIYGVYNLTITGGTGSITSIVNMPSLISVQINLVGTNKCGFVDSGSLQLKGRLNKTLNYSNLDWIVFQTITAIIQEVNSSISTYLKNKATVTLSGTAYTGTVADTNDVYTDGSTYMIQPNSNSPDAATVNLNGAGAKSILKPGGVKINIDDLLANKWYSIVYNSGLSAFEINLPRVITAEYNYATNINIAAGAIGTTGIYNLTANIPAGILLKVSQGYLQTVTTPVSNSKAALQWGLGTGGYDDYLDVVRSITDIAYQNGSLSCFKTRVVPFGSLDITAGAGGTIDTVTVGGVNILHGTVAYATSLANVALLVAQNINANPGTTIRADAYGATVYLYATNNDKFTTADATGTVSGTATTMTVGNFINMGVAGSGAYWDTFLTNGSAKPLSMTIVGNTLLAGKVRIYIPYDVKQ